MLGANKPEDKSFSNDQSESYDKESQAKKDFEFEDIPDYDFEAGKKEIISRVRTLLDKQDTVVIAVSGSGQNVGKSTLRRTLLNNLKEQGIPAVGAHTPDELSKRRIERAQGEATMLGSSENQEDKPVFVFDQMEWHSVIADKDLRDLRRKRHNKEVGQVLSEFGYEVEGIDIWVGIYRPDKPFSRKKGSGDPAKPLADITICNERARGH